MYDDTIVTVDSIEIEHLNQEINVYNFEVENAHTYYVTDKGILVHNLCAGTSSNNSTNLQFDSLDNLNNHYRVHGKEFGDLVKNTDDYIDLANYVIKNGEYIPEMNGYIRFFGSNGGANYAFVGLKNGGKNISTFGIRSVKDIAKTTSKFII